MCLSPFSAISSPEWPSQITKSKLKLRRDKKKKYKQTKYTHPNTRKNGTEQRQVAKVCNPNIPENWIQKKCDKTNLKNNAADLIRMEKKAEKKETKMERETGRNNLFGISTWNPFQFWLKAIVNLNFDSLSIPL